MTALEHFRKRIRREIDGAGVSQRELARRSRIPFVRVNRILQGHVDPKLSAAESLAKAVGKKLSEIFAGAS